MALIAESMLFLGLPYSLPSLVIPTFSGLRQHSQQAAASSSNHIRMLRNYKKSASLKKWCYKSDYFAEKGFTTPNQLELFETENRMDSAVNFFSL